MLKLLLLCIALKLVVGFDEFPGNKRAPVPRKNVGIKPSKSLKESSSDMTGYVYLENDAFVIREKRTNDTWVAKGNWTMRLNETGWSFLEVQTNPKYPDMNQSFAAGMIEGYLSQELISYYYVNMLKGFCDGREKTCDGIMAYFEENLQFIQHLASRHAKNDPYWHQVGLLIEQLHGLTEGYNQAEKENPDLPNLTFSNFWWFNAFGDLEDLTTVFSEDSSFSSDPEKFSQKLRGLGKCSALIKLVKTNETTDLLAAHVTWNSYNSMTRILKKYVFPFRSTSDPTSPVVPGHSMTFSSYPGLVFSGDDFTIISSGLVTIETTIGNDNPALWKNVKANGQVLEWIRCSVANRLAEDGKHWSVLFRRFNSGTYNNQWMIVDYKLFKPGGLLLDNLLWVLEQVPGVTEARDKTEVLREQEYWPSYNNPYFPKIYNVSGVPALVEKYGDWFSYDKTPRALIFKRDQGKVTDLDSMMKLMRYNDYPNDPLSACNCTPPYSAENAISARNDLNPRNGNYPFSALGHRCHGGTDAKVTSSALVTDLRFYAVSGPTANPLPAFQWSKTDFNDSHVGHPDLWNFDPMLHNWKWRWNGRIR